MDRRKLAAGSLLVGSYAFLLWSLLPLGSSAEAAPLLRDGRIVFGRGVGAKQDLYSVRPDGTQLQRLTAAAGAELHPSVASDGRIAYTCGATRFAYESGDICIMRADGSGETKLTNSSAVEEEPSWSPDSRRIVFVREVSSLPFPSKLGVDTDIFSMSADGSDDTQLTGGVEQDQDPDWSPDGRRIIFERATAASEGDIWIMDWDGTDLVNLTPGPAGEFNPTWSPDSSRILFARDMGEHRKLFTMKPDGSDVRTVNHSRSAYSASWSPSGRRIVFHDVYRSTQVALFVIRADGSERRRVIPGLGDDHHSPAWQPAAR